MAVPADTVLLPDPKHPEYVRVERIDGRFAVIRDVPGFNKEFAFGDMIQIVSKMGIPTAENVVEPSSWTGCGLLLTKTIETNGTEIAAILRRMERLGSIAALREGAYVVVAVPAVARENVFAEIESGERAGHWEAAILAERHTAKTEPLRD